MSFTDSIICPQCQERAPTDYVLCPYCGYSLVKIVRERTRVHVGFGQAIDRIRRLLIEPIMDPSRSLIRTRETMREISANPDRKGGLLISFLISVFLLEMVAVYWITTNGFPLLFSLVFLIVFPIFGAFIFFILVFVVWWVFALATWLLARLVGGKGTRKDTSGIVGYALLPLAPAFLVSDLIMFLQDNTDFVAIIILPFLLWTIYLAALGLQHVHSLDRTFSFGISIFLVAIFYLAFIMNIL
ncbi:MAG: YIP1 family protein [Candidatus Heimdallarchaeota archaeon]